MEGSGPGCRCVIGGPCGCVTVSREPEFKEAWARPPHCQQREVISRGVDVKKGGVASPRQKELWPGHEGPQKAHGVTILEHSIATT